MAAELFRMLDHFQKHFLNVPEPAPVGWLLKAAVNRTQALNQSLVSLFVNVLRAVSKGCSWWWRFSLLLNIWHPQDRGFVNRVQTMGHGPLCSSAPAISLCACCVVDLCRGRSVDDAKPPTDVLSWVLQVVRELEWNQVVGFAKPTQSSI